MMKLTRRGLVQAGIASMSSFALPGLVRAQSLVDEEPVITRRNASSFAAQDWRDHFDSLGIVSILADTDSRALHYWSADGKDYRIYPTSVPRTDELTKRGYTKVVRKKVGPDWTPTASMVERFGWTYMPPGPDNPLGTHAMYLTWPAYLIHGTHDTRKIGRKSSDGCIGLFNEKIEELYALTPIGSQVRII